MNKKLLFILQHTPYDSINATEGLDMAIGAATFEYHVNILINGDGIYQLINDQSDASNGLKKYTAVFQGLDLYGIEHIYVNNRDLTDKGLSIDDLMISATPVSQKEIKQLLKEHDFIMTQ